MKKRNVVLTLVVLIGSFCWAQKAEDTIDNSKNYLFLKNGTVKYFDSNIPVKGSIIKKEYIDLGNEKLQNSQVSFVKNGTSFFANISDLDSCHDFVERIDTGKINLYEYTEDVYNYVPAAPGFGGFGAFGYATVSKKQHQFYNSAFLPLKEVTYANLMEDLAKNKASVDYLKKYKKNKTTQIILHTVSSIAMIAGILTSSEGTGEFETGFNSDTGRFEETEVRNIKGANLAVGLTGFVTNIVTYFVFKKNKNNLNKAIEVYNKN